MVEIMFYCAFLDALDELKKFIVMNIEGSLCDPFELKEIVLKNTTYSAFVFLAYKI
jgi:hypothetical protein